MIRAGTALPRQAGAITGPMPQADALAEDQLLPGRFGLTAHAEPQQPQGARDQFLAAREKTSHPVDVAGFGDRHFHAELTCEGGEVAVADLHLHGVCAQMAALQLD